jgi:hypothetical protein
MGFTAIAVTVGLVFGLLTGGHLRHLGERQFRWWGLLVVGVALQLPLLDGLGFGGLLVSYLFLLGFAIANIRLVGMTLVVIGIAMNIAVIAMNRGMPVRREAVVEAGMFTREEVDHLNLDRKHHLERPGDRPMILADIIPMPIPHLRSVLSFGDVVMSVGVADVLVHLLKPRRRRALSVAAATAPSPDAG